jgi:hypothetical protein
MMRSWMSCSRMGLAATLRKRSIHTDFFVNALKVSNPYQREEIWVCRKVDVEVVELNRLLCPDLRSIVCHNNR